MSPQSNEIAVRVVGLTRIYRRGREEVRALDKVSFEVRRGEFIAVVGPSGSGKSTLLNLVGCMDAPSAGTLELFGKPVQGLTERDRTNVRRHLLGFVFQHFGLVPTLTVAENVALPAFFAGAPPGKRLEQLLAKAGLSHRRDHLPAQLSGGEMQRAAIARALVNEPRLILADEPTGNLDSRSGDSIIELFQELNEDGLTIVTVTHNELLAGAAQRRLELVDGRLKSESPVPITS